MHFARDLGATIAARLDQLPPDVARVQEHVDQPAEALRQPHLQARVREHKPERLRQAPIERLGMLLEADVVSQEQLADARSVAAASEVFQQQSVIEFPDLHIVEPDLVTDMDSDPAAANAMSGGLAFDHVQRMAQRPQ